MNVAIGFVLGMCSWGVAEYLLHRFVGHRPRSMTAFAVEHRMHHALGNYFAPTRKKVLAMTPVVLVVLWVGSLVAGTAGSAFGAGLLSMYVAYEWFHRRLHTHGPRNAFGRWARRHHFHHHYGNPRKNHGVTSPVMDWVFGTAEEPGLIRVPVKLVPAWLLDPATGNVFAQYAAQYSVAGGVVPPEDGAPPQATSTTAAVTR